MKAKQFLTDVKKLLWHPLTILLFLMSTSAVAQIDYHYDQINEISNKDSVKRIDWILSSAKKAPLTFSHIVYFTSKNQDKLIGSTVSVYLFHNRKSTIDTVEQFTLNTADHIKSNYIILDQQNAINLKKGDQVYMVFKLNPKNKNENYIFTIKSVNETDEESLKKIQKQAIAVTKPEEKPTQPTKYKNLSSDRKFRKLQRQPMGREY